LLSLSEFVGPSAATVKAPRPRIGELRRGRRASSLARALKLHVEAHFPERLHAMGDLGFDQAESLRGQLDLFELGLEDEVSEPPFEDDDLAPYAGLGAVRALQPVRERVAREIGGSLVWHDVSREELHGERGDVIRGQRDAHITSTKDSIIGD